MNILHMKYAVEVAKVGSLNKASETLLVATPNISRSIKELEGDLGIVIFDRTAKGMELTLEGALRGGGRKHRKPKNGTLSYSWFHSRIILCGILR